MIYTSAKEEPQVSAASPYTENKLGGASIQGFVYDATSKRPIPNVSIIIGNFGTMSNEEGRFELKHLRPGKIELQFSALGYHTVTQSILLRAESNFDLDQAMLLSPNDLMDVVVTGYTTVRKSRELGYSTATVKNINVQNSLTGRVSGLEVKNAAYQGPIILRGIRSLSGNETPIIVVDGIITSAEEFAALDPNMIAETAVLKAAEATTIYGPKGVNGAIIITTRRGGGERKIFRDFGYWMPNASTNNKGVASFSVTYPDNVTGWHSYIIGVDKKFRNGNAEFITQAIKPIVAELALPEFLIDGDKVQFVGKALNYTDDAYTGFAKFSTGNQAQNNLAFSINPKASVLFSHQYEALGNDTAVLGFAIKTTTGYQDAEKKKLPVLPKGTEETTGMFTVLTNDTSFSYSKKTNTSQLTIYAQNNALELVLDEVEHLKNYKYYCLEQTASKLTGLLVQRKIYTTLGKKFTGQNDIDALLKRLLEFQLYSGGWSWWPNGKEDIGITVYIMKAILPFSKDPLIAQSIRNGILYLQNTLPGMQKRDLLAALDVLNEAGNYMSFEPWVKKMHFDSLTTHQQWQFVKILQQQQIPHQKELSILVAKQKKHMLGAIHWAGERFNWKADDVATTLLALDVLEKSADHAHLKPGIIQYLFEQKNKGHWQNTVHSATIIDALTKLYLAANKRDYKQTQLLISGDTTVTINQFPFQFNTNAANINVAKTGSGIVYFTAYEKYFEKEPRQQSYGFQVFSNLKKNGVVTTRLQAGEAYEMVVEMTPDSEAEYVMVEIPIPAGCSYSDKNNLNEYFPQFTKDKVSLFLPKVTKKPFEFKVLLEARYNGTFTINPARASLMYYPVFYGQEDLKKVNIN